MRSRKEWELDWMRLDSTLKRLSSIYLCPKNLDTILMHWMSVKLADNFQICEHSWSCLFHITFVLYLLLKKFFFLNIRKYKIVKGPFLKCCGFSVCDTILYLRNILGIHDALSNESISSFLKLIVMTSEVK